MSTLRSRNPVLLQVGKLCILKYQAQSQIKRLCLVGTLVLGSLKFFFLRQYFDFKFGYVHVYAVALLYNMTCHAGGIHYEKAS